MSNSMTVIQIGDTPVRFRSETWHGYTSSARTRTQNFLFSRDVAFSLSPRIIEPHTISLSGIAFNQGGFSAREQLQQMNRLVGVETDIIAYELQECCEKGCCAACGHAAWYDVVIFTTRGVVQSVSMNESDSIETLTASIVVNTTWETLDRTRWEWAGRRPNVSGPKPTPTELWRLLKPYPFLEDILNADCSGKLFQKQHWDDESISYNPDVWYFIHNMHRPGYPRTGISTDWRNSGGSMIVNCNPDVFSAEPSSLYAFTNLPTSGEIIITVERLYANELWQHSGQVSALDLAEINTALATAGFTGLLATDTLIVGDVSRRYRPGMIIRAGVPLETFYPIQYAAEYPGATGIDKNVVYIVLPFGSEWAAIHTFRRL